MCRKKQLRYESVSSRRPGRLVLSFAVFVCIAPHLLAVLPHPPSHPHTGRRSPAYRFLFPTALAPLVPDAAPSSRSRSPPPTAFTPPDAAPLLPTPLRDTVIPSPSPSGDSPLTRRALSRCGAMAPPWPSLSPPQVVLVASTAPLVLVC